MNRHIAPFKRIISPAKLCKEIKCFNQLNYILNDCHFRCWQCPEKFSIPLWANHHHHHRYFCFIAIIVTSNSNEIDRVEIGFFHLLLFFFADINHMKGDLFARTNEQASSSTLLFINISTILRVYAVYYIIWNFVTLCSFLCNAFDFFFIGIYGWLRRDWTGICCCSFSLSFSLFSRAFCTISACVLYICHCQCTAHSEMPWLCCILFVLCFSRRHFILIRLDNRQLLCEHSPRA